MNEVIAFLATTYEESQKHRISTDNWLRSKKGDLDKKQYEQMKTIAGRVADVEKQTYKVLAKEVKNEPIYKHFLKGVRGIGPAYCGYLVGYIKDIGKFDTVSKLWAYAGLSGGPYYLVKCKKAHTIVSSSNRMICGILEFKKVKNKMVGKKCTAPITESKEVTKGAIRSHRGYRSSWNTDLKKVCWLISKQFVKQGDLYRHFYDQQKLRLSQRPDFRKRLKLQAQGKKEGAGAKAHLDAIARRKTVKLFLSHLWEKWRKIDGLPVTEPYSIAKMGHKTKISA